MKRLALLIGPPMLLLFIGLVESSRLPSEQSKGSTDKPIVLSTGEVLVTIRVQVIEPIPPQPVPPLPRPDPAPAPPGPTPTPAPLPAPESEIEALGRDYALSLPLTYAAAIEETATMLAAGTSLAEAAGSFGQRWEARRTAPYTPIREAFAAILSSGQEPTQAQRTALVQAYKDLAKGLRAGRKPVATYKRSRVASSP